jgi:hypothetical protein
MLLTSVNAFPKLPVFALFSNEPPTVDYNKPCRLLAKITYRLYLKNVCFKPPLLLDILLSPGNYLLRCKATRRHLSVLIVLKPAAFCGECLSLFTLC